MQPPDISEAQKVFQECYDDIQIVVDFLVSSEHGEIIIDADSRTSFKDVDGYHSESVELVLDTKTEEAVKRLLNGEYEKIIKWENTIQIIQWHRFTGIGCGVAYTINGQDSPEIQFVTELIPMKEDGWYYYVVDYNKWRLENNQ